MNNHGKDIVEPHSIRKSRLLAGFIFLLIAVIAALLIVFLPDKKTEQHSEQVESSFQKDAIAEFFDKNGQKICEFEVELADTAEKIKTGLMYRDSLAVNQGMLFIFDVEESKSFWMKNTYLPLDIVFISADSSIVSIAENTIPFSEQSVLSKGPAKFVLEINAGISLKWGLKIGDKITWKRIKQEQESL